MITELIQETFEEHEIYLKSLKVETDPPLKHTSLERPPNPESKSDGDEFNFYPENSQAVQLNTKIERYTNVPN
ncbi:hypothetical protein PtA15_12A88 [Puccinia triticina]|uniref:Uncharacterized protein n=1 Tax=Puccinia triticina TaxID=208348 RepID=A0ABY7D0H7_9BASI|nr:uncharacterized protein PtA15_12A88 [Puccinia triticina]WAQ90103.1 hypothetical protein PtA15_12A88 [Puccinia triticina]